jgi:formylglycine-generating enzyme required for sulfatase activity
VKKEPEMVFLPGGTFSMGETGEDKFANATERPRTPVVLEAFWLGKFPVTVAEFRAFCPEYPATNPGDWPVVSVSWHQARAYCQWLGPEYRLPTEAEWEGACRAGTETPYWWGEVADPSRANYLYEENGHKVGPGHPTAAGAYPANPYGLFDMLGNVNEWVEDDWFPSHEGRPERSSLARRLECGSVRKVLRGGAWDYLPRLLRSCWRDRLDPSACRDNVGFRVARSA